MRKLYIISDTFPMYRVIPKALVADEVHFFVFTLNNVKFKLQKITNQ